MNLQIARILCILMLFCVGCGGGSDSYINNSAPIVITPITTTTVEPTETRLTETTIIPMHYGILCDEPWAAKEETGGSVFAVAAEAQKGDIIIKLIDASNLKSKLFSYLGRDRKYYSNTVDHITGDDVYCSYPLSAAIEPGDNVFHFYRNFSHPDKQGFYTIVDSAIDSIPCDVNNGTHVLFGDSWITAYTGERMRARLDKAIVISKGIGGDTTQRLLDRFDRDVTPSSPDYVWVMVGTNDVYQGLATDVFIKRLKLIESKILAIGAIPIIFDTSVCVESYQGISFNLHERSSDYADAIHEAFKPKH
jgi:hypothetical protein